MKWNKLFIAAAGSLLAFSIANADRDLCDQAVGTWNGTGTVKAHSLRCEYTGSVVVTPGTQNNFTAAVSLTLVSGLCPATVTETLPGSCRYNKFMLRTDNLYLMGTLKGRRGDKAEANGIISLNIGGAAFLGHINTRLYKA